MALWTGQEACPTLTNSTGRGWSLKSELGEVVGGEGGRFLGVEGNGADRFRYIHLDIMKLCGPCAFLEIR
jgi:hypothetical protein